MKQYGMRRILKPGTVPSVFQWTIEKKQRKPPSRRNCPAAFGSSDAAAAAVASTATDEPIEVEVEHVQVTEQLEKCTSCSKCRQNDHDYAARPTTQDQLTAARVHISELEHIVTLSNANKFGLERYSTDDKKIKFYTGFKSYKTLIKFYENLTPHIQTMRTWKPANEIGDETAHASVGFKLKPIDQLFMFLNKLRLGSFDQDLADKFSVSQSTVSRIVLTWVNFLYATLAAQPLWPSRERVQKYMPQSFKKLYPNTRVVIDCTEIAVQSPSSMVLNSETFSSYKGRNTMKCLVGVTPSGAVSFVSALHAGSISDKQIVIVSGFLNLLQCGDLVMADKGFPIDDLLAERQCSLVIPNFLQQKGQFSAAEADENKLIANLRVHVERANRRFKEFHLFDSSIPLVLAGSVNQLWTVACLLTNFQGPLIVNI